MTELQAEVAAFREQLAELRQVQEETEDRLELSERMLRQLRDGPAGLPPRPQG